METTMGKYFSKDVNVAASGSQESTGETCNQDTVDTSTSVDERNMLGGTENRDNRDKVIHLPKLLAQLLNAKVVLERLEEPLIKLYREKNYKDYTRRYCAKCKKTVIARINDSKMRNCSDCKTEMTYLCIKCNVKQYKRYAFLKYHLNCCNGDGKWPVDGTDDVDRSESNVEGTSGAGVRVPQLVLRKDQFIVKKIDRADLSEQYVRRCSECDVVQISNSSRCRTCGKYLLFACKKCNAMYKSRQGLSHHVRSSCYQTCQYRCTVCERVTTSWSKMRQHFKYIHTDQPLLKCEFCSFVTWYKQNLDKHKRDQHCRKSLNVFKCERCNYSTRFQRNFRRHQTLCH